MEDIIERLKKENPNALMLNNLNEAIIGIGKRNDKKVLKYSFDKIIKILMNKEKMSYNDALDWFYFNIENAFMGENTPIIEFNESEN